MKVKVKKVYGPDDGESVEHLKGKYVACGDYEGSVESSQIYAIYDKFDGRKHNAKLGYYLLRWSYIGELEWDCGHEKIYHKGNRQEAKHLIGKNIEYYSFVYDEWLSGRLDFISNKSRTDYFFAITSEPGVSAANIKFIRECPQPLKITMADIKEKFGREVEIVDEVEKL
jgi:hypothetical protein